MPSVCLECGYPLNEELRRLGASLCPECASADPYAEDTPRLIKRCDSCGGQIKFGRCWRCAAGDHAKPRDPRLMKPLSKSKRKMLGK